TCPSNCVKVCGDGVVEGDEACDAIPFDNVNCMPPGGPNQCQKRVQSCGDGVTSGSEACDTNGNIGPDQKALTGGATCSADCTTIVSPVCGDGVVNGMDQCDAGTGTPANPVRQGSPTCGSNCVTVASQACVDCENAGDCFASVNNCENATFTQ